MKLQSEIHTLNRVNLYEQIADYVEKMILDGDNKDWEEGGKLPSEQELADSFGVSRNVVREAIKLLKERGLVDPKNGVGAYVTKPDPQKLSALIYRFVLMDDIDVESIYDIRILLERYSAERAAERCTDEELKHMRALLSKMENRSISINERRETDYAFHVAISKASGNPLCYILITALRDVFIAMIEKGIFIHGGIEDACVRHERILKALEAHDAEEAKAAMDNHLATSLQHVSAYDKHDFDPDEDLKKRG